MLMKKATLVVFKPFLDNRIFDTTDTGLNRDNLLAPFHRLKRAFRDHNYDLSTQDINPPEDAEIVIYNDSPGSLPGTHVPDKSYLLALENPFHCKGNVNPLNRNRYRKVFTWNDNLVDGNQFIKINYSAEIPIAIPRNLANKNKLALLISANKSLNTEFELYSKRIETIRWFEQHHPEQFDLYGFDWDKQCFMGLLRPLNRSVFLRKHWPHRAYPSWQGTIDNKALVMQRYWFAVCYENVADLPGYITEKIFDAFFAGCVPIYLGANNITDYVPTNCFIDARNFANHQELYQHLCRIDVPAYNLMLDAIAHFLSSTAIEQFSAEYFAQTITTEILEK
jgi:hypothetical protein